MHALFIELSSFEKYRADYLNDDQFRLFQSMLLADPESGLSIIGPTKKASSSCLPSTIKISVTS